MSVFTVLVSAALCVLDMDLTMYHVNPVRYGPIPLNTDTADVTGDLFFELFEKLSIPLACNDPTVPAKDRPFECRNLESDDPTDVCAEPVFAALICLCLHISPVPVDFTHAVRKRACSPVGGSRLTLNR
jgi:hypothetical protein